MKINGETIKSPSFFRVLYKKEGDSLKRHISLKFDSLTKNEVMAIAPRLFQTLSFGFIDEKTGNDCQFSARLSHFAYSLKKDNYTEVEIKIEEI